MGPVAGATIEAVKGSGSFLLGVLVGALAVVVASRTRETLERDNEAELADKMRDYLAELEDRISGEQTATSKPRAGTAKKPVAKKAPAKRASNARRPAPRKKA